MATRKTIMRGMVCALALGAAACSDGSNIASPGATDPASIPGGGSGGGSGGGGGSATFDCTTIGLTTAGTAGANTVCALGGQILADTTLALRANVVYKINGRVDVGVDVGASGTAAGGRSATLTIQPGVTLFGEAATDILIVNRGSKIQAVGTAAQPIVFSSRSGVDGTANPATTSRQWGGVIILGRAPIRKCASAVTQGTAACEEAVEGVLNATGRNALFGGATPADDSGRMSYIRVEYPGAFLTNSTVGDDLNGITLGGVGSATVLDHIQVHNSGDDGIEWFGGSVGVKNVAITGALDDSLDYDAGWTGNVQFAVIKQTTGVGDRLVEASNHPGVSNAGNVQTNPTISNFTFFATRSNGQIELNASGGAPGSSGMFNNGVVVNAASSIGCVNAEAAATSPAPTFNSILFDCTGTLGTNSSARITAGANNSTTTANTLSSFLLPGGNETARTAVNPTTLGSFFSAGSFIGAFPASATTTSNEFAGWTTQLFPDVGCPTGTTQGSNINGQRRCILSGTLAGVTRLTPGNVYEINGRVDVGADRGAGGTGGAAATLTIDAGVTLFGDEAADILIVNRGSQLFVNGTQTQPVIMTSRADLTNTQADPVNATREWGGLILLGRAPIRKCASAVAQGSAACEEAVEGVLNATGRNALFGGATPTDNSGRINYLQVRYPGAFLTSSAVGDDLNGITLGGVGSGTVIDNVQVHNSGDDGIEWFGGTVGLKHVVVTGALDDSLDYDAGWTGNMQFAVVLQRVTSGNPDRLVEASNHPGVSNAGTLHTNPTITNFTFRGIRPVGIELNASGGAPGSSGQFSNGVVVGSTTCIAADAANTSPAPTFRSMLLNCTGALGTAAANLVAAGTNNTTATADTLVSTGATAAFINGTTETARTPVDPTTLGSFFSAAPYIGAVRNTSDNWWKTWTCSLETGSSC